MKILIMFIALMMSVNAFAATAVLRQGEFIDQYAIDDPGNASGFDNIRMIFSFGLSEVLIQTSGVNFITRKANLLCWNDPDVVECPNDDIGGGVYREPEIMLLEEIFLANGVTVGADLTELREKEIYLGFWHEYRTAKVIDDVIVELDLLGLNDLQKVRNLRSVYFGLGIDWTTSQTLAQNRINNSIEATYVDYNLATVPLQDRRLLILFGEVGWFE